MLKESHAGSVSGCDHVHSIYTKVNREEEPYLNMSSFALDATISALSMATAMHCWSTATRRIGRHVMGLTYWSVTW